VLEGPGGDAQKELIAAIEKTGNWNAYAQGITAYIKRVRGDRDPATVAKVIGAYQELARVYVERLRQVPRAIEVLREGCDATDRNPQLVLALARRQRES